MTPNQKPINARNAKHQQAGKFDEIIAFVGSEAEPYNKTGYELILQALKLPLDYKAVFVGKQELARLPLLKFAPEGNECEMITFYQLGELTSNQKTLIAQAVADCNPAIKTARLLGLDMQELENWTDYIARIREGKTDRAMLAQMKEREQDQAPKTEPYFDERTKNGIKGLFYIIPKIDKDTGEILNEKERWTSEPLTLKGEGYAENGEAFYMFEFTHPRTGKPQIEAIPLTVFGKASGWEMLQKYGLKMTNESHLNKLADYFHFNGNHATKWTITEKTGWHNGAYMLPNGENLGQPHSPVYFRNRDDGENAYSTAGTLESWQKNVGNYLRGNPFLMLGIATALAGPLLNPLKAKSFGVHIYDDSSKGKTTALNVANSIWGEPKLLEQKWSQTPVAMMNNALSKNDNFLTLDEMKQVTNFDDLENVAYLLFNETGKARGKKDGGNQKIARWQMVALTTGENSLEGFLQGKGRDIQAGSLVRLLNIPMEEAREWHGFKTSKDYVDHLNEQASEHYGVLGREWIYFIMANREQLKPTFKHYLGLWLARLPADANGQLQRVATNFAILETALQLAKHLTGWSEEENREAIIKAFNNWLAVFGTRSKEETMIIEKFNGWILSAQHTDFITVKIMKNGEQNILKPATSREIAGYYFLADEHFAPKEHFFIFPSVFNKVNAGRAKEVAIRALANAKMLDKALEYEKRPYQKRLSSKLDASRPFCYVVYKLEEAEDE